MIWWLEVPGTWEVGSRSGINENILSWLTDIDHLQFGARSNKIPQTALEGGVDMRCYTGKVPRDRSWPQTSEVSGFAAKVETISTLFTFPKVVVRAVETL